MSPALLEKLSCRASPSPANQQSVRYSAPPHAESLPSPHWSPFFKHAWEGCSTSLCCHMTPQLGHMERLSPADTPSSLGSTLFIAPASWNIHQDGDHLKAYILQPTASGSQESQLIPEITVNCEDIPVWGAIYFLHPQVPALPTPWLTHPLGTNMTRALSHLALMQVVVLTLVGPAPVLVVDRNWFSLHLPALVTTIYIKQRQNLLSLQAHPRPFRSGFKGRLYGSRFLISKLSILS